MNLSSNSFSNDPDAARMAANHGPVFITERGLPTHVLLNIADYQKLLGQTGNVTALLSMSSVVDVDWTPTNVVLSSRPTGLT
jgi:hypothetical protein